MPTVITAPPPYSLQDSEMTIDTPGEAFSLQGHTLGDEANDILNEVLSGEHMKHCLADEISGLTQHALTIDLSFRHASAQLGEIVKYSGLMKAEVEALKDQWDERRRRFVDLMWESRATAVKAKAIADDFAGDFIRMLQDPSIPRDTKRIEIARYKKKLAEDQYKAQKISQGFTDLKEWVENFRKIFPRTWSSVKAANGKRIDAIEEKISGLEESVRALDKKLTRLLLAMKITLGIAGASLLAFVCPFSWVAIVVAACAELAEVACMIKYRNERECAQRQIFDLRAELSTLRKDDRGVLAVRTALHDIEHDTNNITSKLAAFSLVWAMIASDLGEIEVKMEKIESDDENKRFNKGLKTVAALYRSLSYALYQYATTINLETLFKDKGKKT